MFQKQSNDTRTHSNKVIPCFRVSGIKLLIVIKHRNMIQVTVNHYIYLRK